MVYVTGAVQEKLEPMLFCGSNGIQRIENDTWLGHDYHHNGSKV